MLENLNHHRHILVPAIVGVTLCCICNAVAQQATKHDAKAFECGFIYDKMKRGKSGAATCSYLGEKVFSSPSQSFPADEHCKTELDYGYEDFINFRIDLATNTVTWDQQSGLASFAELEMIEYYMRKEKINIRCVRNLR